ncbi:hypothetical protein N7508_009879 [Penicillium antarcticum]|uniref:uncharacterized protein n=1 Tax=Penicillium antarcticum TaxID=416450 RepID=UPI00238CCB7A|nr:uncharacterized protein N7508_009879 [Penicillium antarcticum]KAJ5295058.1 hypothetical protein N7508_009879 [Penicillium antarcticum]
MSLGPNRPLVAAVEPRMEICCEEITRGRYGDGRAIYFRFKVTILDAEKFKNGQEVRFLFRDVFRAREH